ncbi:unnamed protein product [Caenorhabditis sp. 36 PRJEB53466]|nr:unnamed protein product [Caenorhabditis sp. 36 PRJEB53466]
MFQELKDEVFIEFFMPHWTSNNTILRQFLSDIRELKLSVPNYTIISESIEKWMKLTQKCRSLMTDLGEDSIPWYRIVCDAYGSSGVLKDIQYWIINNIPEEVLPEFTKDESIWIEHDKKIIPLSPFFTLAGGYSVAQRYGSLGFWFIRHIIQKLDFAALAASRPDLNNVLTKNDECILRIKPSPTSSKLRWFDFDVTDKTPKTRAIVAEATANIYALRKAMWAFKKYSPQTFNTMSTHSNGNRTSEQMFFYSAAMLLDGPTIMGPKKLEIRHLNLVVSQLQEFPNAFHCKKEDELAWAGSCSIYPPRK